MSRSIRRLVLPPLAAASLLVAAAASALAASPSATVSVFNADGTPAGATVCEFYVEFSPVPGGEDGTWELWGPGDTLVDDGTYSVTATTADRVPNSGSWSLPNATYTLLWDSEDHVDSSRSEAEIVVACETPSQSVGAETDVPSQSIAADTATPDRTLPDTASFGTQGRPDPSAWTGLIAAILGLAAFVLVLTPRRGTGRR